MDDEVNLLFALACRLPLLKHSPGEMHGVVDLVGGGRGGKRRKGEADDGSVFFFELGKLHIERVVRREDGCGEVAGQQDSLAGGQGPDTAARARGEGKILMIVREYGVY